MGDVPGDVYLGGGWAAALRVDSEAKHDIISVISQGRNREVSTWNLTVRPASLLSRAGRRNGGVRRGRKKAVTGCTDKRTEPL